jgi:hypothetical protein
LGDTTTEINENYANQLLEVKQTQGSSSSAHQTQDEGITLAIQV